MGNFPSLHLGGEITDKLVLKVSHLREPKGNKYISGAIEKDL